MVKIVNGLLQLTTALHEQYSLPIKSVCKEEISIGFVFESGHILPFRFRNGRRCHNDRTPSCSNNDHPLHQIGVLVLDWLCTL